jgi:glycine cleavage system transcriptional repressor
MKQLFALSAIGRDRPGIVADLAELIYECDCNLEDSRMTILGSEFAVLLLLSGQGADVARRLSAGCKRLEWEKRLTVFFRPLEGDVSPDVERPGRMLECVVTGVDKAGIVARIARTLADHGANVEDLRTELRPEPESGTPIYTMRLAMWLGPDVDERALRAALERDAGALCVDVSLGERGSLPADR